MKMIKFVLCAILAAAVYILMRSAATPAYAPAPVHSGPVVPSPAPAKLPSAQAPLLTLANDAQSQSAVRAVEQMIAPKHAALAMARMERGRFMCLLIEGEQRQFSLDVDVAESDLPFLKRYGFAVAPPAAYRTTSMYQSAAKAAMHYDQAGGDRLIVLLCPQKDWAELQMEAPVLNLPPLPTTSPPAGGATEF